jgi:hypothetical protein
MVIILPNRPSDSHVLRLARILVTSDRSVVL